MQLDTCHLMIVWNSSEQNNLDVSLDCGVQHLHICQLHPLSGEAKFQLGEPFTPNMRQCCHKKNSHPKMWLLQVQVASPTSLSVFKAFLVVLFFALSIYFILSVYSLYMILKIQKKSVTTFLDQEFEQGSKRHPSEMRQSSPLLYQHDKYFDYCRFILPHIRRRGAPYATVQVIRSNVLFANINYWLEFSWHDLQWCWQHIGSMYCRLPREKTVPMTESEDKGREHVLYAKM